MTPTERISACERGWGLCNQARADGEAVLAKEREHIALLIKQREELLRQEPSGGRIPWFVWTVLGVAGGVILTRGIR